MAKHGHVTTSARSTVAFLGSSEATSVIANTAPCEVGRQLRAIGATPVKARPAGRTLRAVRAYARKVFGSTAKANRWLERPSTRLGGERPIAWLQNHGDPADVYSALDAIAFGTPV
ncbi:antitoxin Xre/MbcA/ParS toxin-binding domain-containing protein [Burkholderia cepacia]|uniref:antitoxin Xre/MbcA/ParS toxin-binding domain-containing protein n=1 Tax=Burkholderia cepacia TaxID=292 RepID=UPI00162AC9EA